MLKGLELNSKSVYLLTYLLTHLLTYSLFVLFLLKSQNCGNAPSTRGDELSKKSKCSTPSKPSKVSLPLTLH